MPVVEPVYTGYAALYGILHGDATFLAQVSGIFQVAAPANIAPNFCLMNLQSSTDTNTSFGARVLTRQIYQIKICGPIENEVAIRAAYARADTLLQPGGLPLRNTSNTLAIFREQAISYAEMRGDGTLWTHYGGLYRVEV